ncbi:MAG TPA: acylphosphatase [Acidimicrobiia bacterium]|jgi:acylphosphatase
MSEIKAVHALVRGKVQGIGFRQATRSWARSLDLLGWVRNNERGDVEVWAQGPPQSVDRLVDWLWSGPPGAVVVGVESDVVASDPLLRDFFIRQ